MSYQARKKALAVGRGDSKIVVSHLVKERGILGPGSSRSRSEDSAKQTLCMHSEDIKIV